MGFFDAFLQLTTDIIVTPLAIVKDVVTLGGALTDEESVTLQKLKDIGEDIDILIENK